MSENGTAESVDPGALVGRVQELTQQLEAVQDPAARDLAEELMAAIVRMYGAGVERIVQAVAEGGRAGRQIMDRLAEDGVETTLTSLASSAGAASGAGLVGVVALGDADGMGAS